MYMHICVYAYVLLLL